MRIKKRHREKMFPSTVYSLYHLLTPCSIGIFAPFPWALRRRRLCTSKKDEKYLSTNLSFFILIYMQKSSFEQFEATSLYCPRCRAAVPVRRRLLLVLPEGEEYEYLCAYCSTSVGTKMDKSAPQIDVLIKP
jgi:hypothetical protein